MERISINDCRGWEERSRKATDRLLSHLRRHHDYDIPLPGIERRSLEQRALEIEIKAIEPESLPVEICILPIPKPRLTAEAIKRVVCKHFVISHTDMISHRRERKYHRPRMVAMYLARELTTLGYPTLGRLFGDRDHTSVMHSVQLANKLIAANDPISRDITFLREMLAA